MNRRSARRCPDRTRDDDFFRRVGWHRSRESRNREGLRDRTVALRCRILDWIRDFDGMLDGMGSRGSCSGSLL